VVSGDKMNIAILVIQGLILLSGGFLYFYVKKLPEYIFQKSVKKFEFQLNSKLEEIKASLTKEIELLKISQAELQIHKTKEFVNFVEYFNSIFTNPKEIAKITSHEQAARKFNQKMLDLGIKLFFFASDETVKKYVEWRKYGLQTGQEYYDNKKTLLLYAELVTLMRRDLGYQETGCTRDDFLNIMLTDWDKHQDQYQNSVE